MRSFKAVGGVPGDDGRIEDLLIFSQFEGLSCGCWILPKESLVGKPAVCQLYSPHPLANPYASFFSSPSFLTIHPSRGPDSTTQTKSSLSSHPI